MAAVSTPQDVDYSQYLIDPERSIKSIDEKSEPRLFMVVTFDDDSQWVVLPDYRVDRFCGYLYLREKLQGNGTLQPAENRLFWDGKSLAYLSKYCGAEKVGAFEGFTEKKSLGDVGFEDLGNLRKLDGVIYVFDTEKGSFDKRVYEEIDEFRKVHDAALTALKARDLASTDD